MHGNFYIFVCWGIFYLKMNILNTTDQVTECYSTSTAREELVLEGLILYVH
jgi:hypothetical protein